MTKTYKQFIVGLFVLFLIAPGTVMLLGIESKDKYNEHHVFQSAPEITLKSPLKSLRLFKGYFNENFGLKTYFVNNYLNFKTTVLKENPIPNRTVKGTNDWYFLGNFYNKTLDNTYGNSRLTNYELSTITNNVKHLASYFKSKGIIFHIVVAPNKNNIYKENLPYRLSQKETNLNLIESHLKTTLGFEIINLAPVLKANKLERQLYLKSDSHWNDYGAFLGYKKIMSVINTDLHIPTLSIEYFHIIDTTKINGDITSTINVFEKVQDVSLKKKVKTKSFLEFHTNEKIVIRNPDRSKKLILYRDSFSNNIIDFFKESFETSVFLKNYQIDKNFIGKENPDIVIFEIVERNLVEILIKKIL